MAGGHEGVYEDGVLETCGICQRQVHMLDPQEMDWICDDCSTEGWAGVRQAWKLSRGHRVSIRGHEGLVISANQVGRFVELELLDPQGDLFLRYVRGYRPVYVNEYGDYERATEVVRQRGTR